MDADFQKNVILTETERLTMDGRSKSGPKYARNKNVLVIGALVQVKQGFMLNRIFSKCIHHM